ncbi:radical SAM/SPASM domain-containing protein [Elusimicrobiota bacterium]
MVTWKCNAKCIMCDAWKKKDMDELNIDEIDDIFRQLGKMDAVRIGGGEPFMRTDIAEIINIVQKRTNPGIIHITTNGLLDKQVVDVIEKAEKTDNLHIKISIDDIGEENNKIRGVNNAFERSMITLKKLAPLREKYGFFLGVNQTIISSDNAKRYKELKKICGEYGVKLYVVLAYNDSALYKTEEHIDMLPKKEGYFNAFGEFTKTELENLLELLEKDAKSMDNIVEKIVKKYYLKGLNNRILKGSSRPNPPCTALRSHLRILPDGSIPICLFNSTIIGSLRKNSFKDIWFGKDIEKYRKIVNKCSGCWAECEIVPNAVYCGDIVKGII